MNPYLFSSDFRPDDEIILDESTIRVVSGGFLSPSGTRPTERLTLSPSRLTGGPLRVRRGDSLVTPWPYQRVAVVDTETTGLGDDARIVEIAVVQMRFGLVVKRWSSLVNPGVPIPPEATAVHGITDAMVAGAPQIEALAPQIAAAFDGAEVIAGYNVFGYDEAVLSRHGLMPGLHVVDALPLVRAHAVSVRDGMPAKRWKSESEKREYRDEGDDGPVTRIDWRRVGRHSLERASRELGLDYPEVDVGTTLHRATWDAILTGRVLYALRAWCPWSASEAETLLRDLHARQGAEQAAWRESMRAKSRAAAPSVDARIESMLAELRLLLAEQAGFRQWKAGAKSPEESA